MRKMKDSGIEWIGEIPEDWDVHRLAGLGEFSGSGNDKKINPDEPTVKMINYVDVYNNKTYELNADIDYMTVSCPENKYSELLVQKGDLIFTPSSETIDDIGISALVVDDLKNTVYSYHVLRYRANEKIDFSFKKYLCNNHYARNYFSSKAVGTVRKTLNRDDFKNLKIALPPIEAQAKIAIYLDKKCAEIDAIIAAKEKTNELLKERRQSIIYEAVTKGLDPTVPMKDSGVEWIGEIPEHWSVIRAKYFATINNGTDPKTEGDIPVYGSGSESFKTCGEYKEGPCVLLGRKGATLHIPHFIEGKYWNVDTAFDVKTDESICLLKYYYYASICFDYQLYISTTTLPGMTQSNYGNMFLPIPDTDEQESIVLGLEALLLDVDMLIETNNSTIEKLKDYRQSVIYEAVTGKVEI